MTIEEKYEKQRSDLMHALCSLLPFNEWNNTLLENAENKCNFARAYTYVLFPNGLKEVVDYFEEWQDNRMIQSLAEIKAPSKIKEKIALALKIRIIELNTKFISIRNYTHFALPTNTKLGVKVSWRTCDIIWNYAGDESTDYNYYTKRSLLLTAYITSLMYYISDDSENYVNTRNFIDGILNDIMNISFKLKDNFKLPQLADIPFIRLFS